MTTSDNEQLLEENLEVDLEEGLLNLEQKQVPKKNINHKKQELQKQLFENFLQNSSFQKFDNIHRKILAFLGVSFNKIAGRETCNSIKKRPSCFPVNIENFLRTAFSI